VVQLAPPITIGRDEIDLIVAILEKTFLEASEFLKVLIAESEAKARDRLDSASSSTTSSSAPTPTRPFKKADDARNR
jgi:hypothetical protein